MESKIYELIFGDLLTRDISGDYGLTDSGKHLCRLSDAIVTR